MTKTERFEFELWRLLGITAVFFWVNLICNCGVDEPEIDPCEDWTWIEEDGCSGDVCADQDQEVDGYECRDGECWCCLADDCWKG